MVGKVAAVFMENESKLLAGTLDNDLLSCLPADVQLLLKKVGKVSKEKVYRYPKVALIEVAGYNVIGGLLAEFVEALMNPDTKKSKALLRLIPPRHRLHCERESLYQDLQSIVDFISGMTDLFALDFYRTISGIALPELR